MKAAFIKLFIALIPPTWNLLSKSAKWGVAAIGFVIITVYSILVVWAALRMELITAYDERWYVNYKEAHSGTDTTIKAIQTDMSSVREKQKENSDDLRDIRNVLLNWKR